MDKAKQSLVLWGILYQIFTSQPLMDNSHVNGCLEICMHNSDAPSTTPASRATVGINSAAAAAAPELAWSGLMSLSEEVILIQECENNWNIYISKATIATEKILRLWLTTQAVKANTYLNSDL